MNTIIMNRELENPNNTLLFVVEQPVENLKISWKNNSGFLMMYLYGPGEILYGQRVTTTGSGCFYIDSSQSSTSPCCLSLSSPEKSLGQWKLVYSAIKTGENFNVNFIIENCDREEIQETKELNILNQEIKWEGQKRWYAGDFHSHTIYSDGQTTREENNSIAQEQGLDFYAPTDHNIFHYYWPESEVTIIPGIEITSQLGHINLLFSEKNPFAFDNIDSLFEEESFNRIIYTARDYSLISINHPFMNPWEFLSESFQLDRIDTFEIINDPTYSTSVEAYERALKGWDILLNNGYKITAIGCSDAHLRPFCSYAYSKFPSVLGDPKTMVFALGKDPEYLKEGVKKGRVVVTRNKLIELKCGKYYVGDSIEVSGRMNFKALIHEMEFRGESLEIHWILDGQLIKIERNQYSEINLDIDKDYHWLRVDVRTNNGLLYGFTNPIFLNIKEAKEPKCITWGDLLLEMKERE